MTHSLEQYTHSLSIVVVSTPVKGSHLRRRKRMKSCWRKTVFTHSLIVPFIQFTGSELLDQQLQTLCGVDTHTHTLVEQ